LKKFKLYVLKGLSWSGKFMLLPRSLERISKGRISSSLRGFWSTTSLRWIAKSWSWNVRNVAMKTSSSSLEDGSFSSSRSLSWRLVQGVCLLIRTNLAPLMDKERKTPPKAILSRPV
jgi:hypothetical protein